ncbi:MAG: nuclease-related domain-containing protein [Candidatus Nitrosopumilus sp. bin_68KS]
MTNPETKIQEEKIIEFLKNLEFDWIISNPIIKDGKDQIGEIDSLFVHEDYLFIIEVSTKQELDNQKKNFFFSKWSDGYNLRKLRKQCNVNKKKTVRVYFDRVTNAPENHAGLDHITERRKGNKVIYADKYEELQEDLKKSASSARNNFLKFIET